MPLGLLDHVSTPVGRRPCGPHRVSSAIGRERIVRPLHGRQSPTPTENYVDDTTLSAGQDGSTDTSSNGDWEGRYKGLQKVVSQRDRDLAAITGERDALKARLDSEAEDRQAFEAYRQEQSIASQEQARRAQYEALKAEFEVEDEPPTPRRAGSHDVWPERFERKAPRTEDAEVRGFPV